VSWQRYCTASSSGRQPKFAALNRGRHPCSAGRPSRWALAHIPVSNYFDHLFAYLLIFDRPVDEGHLNINNNLITTTSSISVAAAVLIMSHMISSSILTPSFTTWTKVPLWSCSVVRICVQPDALPDSNQSDRLFGKRRNVREFDSCQRNVMELATDVTGKSCQKLFIANLIFWAYTSVRESLTCTWYFLPQYTNVTDRQDRQRSDSIGWTVLQTVGTVLQTVGQKQVWSPLKTSGLEMEWK